jgi:hypothetical protein
MGGREIQSEVASLLTRKIVRRNRPPVFESGISHDRVERAFWELPRTTQSCIGATLSCDSILPFSKLLSAYLLASEREPLS